MAFLKFLLYGCLVFIVALTRSIADTENERYSVQDYVMPSHYDVNLMVLFNQSLLYDEILLFGECNITIDLKRATRNITMHIMNFQIRKMVLIDNKLENHSGYIPNYLYIDKEDMTILDFTNALLPKNALSPGTYILMVEYSNIEYEGQKECSGCYYTYGERDKIWLVAKSEYMLGARRIFPCWDDPHYKATFNISIKHYHETTALSSMPVRIEYLNTDTYNHINKNLLWTHFHKSPLMLASRLVFAVTTFAMISTPYNTVNMLCRQSVIEHIQYAHNIAENVYNFQWQHWKKISKVDYIAIPNFKDFRKTSHLGVIFDSEANIIYNKKLDTVARRLQVAYSVARKTAINIWFDGVNLWSKENFATFLATYILDKLYPGNQGSYQHLFAAIHRESLHFDSPINVSLTYSKSQISSPRQIKATVVWRMLQHIIPDDVFWTSIRTYVNEKYSAPDAATRNLWTIMQHTLDVSSNNTHKFNIKKVMHIWRTEKYYPVLQVKRNYWNNTATITCEPHITWHSKQYWIPVTYMTLSRTFNRNNDDLIWLTQENPTYKITGTWNFESLIINLQTAYYRVNYDDENWRRIAFYLNSEYYTKIPVLNRAQLIDDAFHFLLQNKFDFFKFWELTKFLQYDTDYITWHSAIKAFEYMTCIFLIRENDYIKNNMQILFEKLLANIRYDDINTNTRSRLTQCLRQEAMHWACTLRVSSCTDIATVRLQDFIKDIKDNITTDLSPWWREWIFCKGMMNASNDTWHDVKNMWNEEKLDYKILEFLTCSDNSEIIINYLQLINKRNFVGIDQSYCLYCYEARKARVTVFLLTVMKHIRKQTVFNFILGHFQTIVPREINVAAALIVTINHMQHSVKQYQKIEIFMKYYKNKTVIQAVKDKIRQRRSQVRSRLIYYSRLHHPIKET